MIPIWLVATAVGLWIWGEADSEKAAKVKDNNSSPPIDNPPPPAPNAPVPAHASSVPTPDNPPPES